MVALVGFAEACYNQNSVDELRACLLGKEADLTDCKEWGISATEWREAIQKALDAKLLDLLD